VRYPRFSLVLEAPGVSADIHSLRRILKSLLRVHGWRCVSVAAST
jgi:hypothetical protein